MEYLIIAIILFAVMYFGYHVGRFFASETDDKTFRTENIAELQDLYCFECEIEMPVKEKNGRMYCSNCGLYH